MAVFEERLSEMERRYKLFVNKHIITTSSTIAMVVAVGNFGLCSLMDVLFNIDTNVHGVWKYADGVGWNIWNGCHYFCM